MRLNSNTFFLCGLYFNAWSNFLALSSCNHKLQLFNSDFWPISCNNELMHRYSNDAEMAESTSSVSWLILLRCTELFLLFILYWHLWCQKDIRGFFTFSLKHDQWDLAPVGTVNIFTFISYIVCEWYTKISGFSIKIYVPDGLQNYLFEILVSWTSISMLRKQLNWKSRDVSDFQGGPSIAVNPSLMDFLIRNFICWFILMGASNG